MNRYRNVYLHRDDLLVNSPHRATSFKLPIAISYLLDTKVERTSAALEERGEETTTRKEMVGMLIAMAGRDDIADLSLEERVLRYREMTVGDLIGQMEE